MYCCTKFSQRYCEKCYFLIIQHILEYFHFVSNLKEKTHEKLTKKGLRNALYASCTLRVSALNINEYCFPKFYGKVGVIYLS